VGDKEKQEQRKESKESKDKKKKEMVSKQPSSTAEIR